MEYTSNNTFPQIKRPRLVCVCRPDFGLGAATAQNLAAEGKPLSSPQGLGGFACHISSLRRLLVPAGMRVASRVSFNPPHYLSFISLHRVLNSSPPYSSHADLIAAANTSVMFLVWHPVVSWPVNFPYGLLGSPGSFHGSQHLLGI